MDRPTIHAIGPRGTYSHQVAGYVATKLRRGHRLDPEIDLAPTIDEALRRFAGGAGPDDLAIVPIETGDGLVRETARFWRARLRGADSLPSLCVVGEVPIPIRHCLAVRTDWRGKVRRVLSKSDALAQCRTSLLARGFETEETLSTAAAAEALATERRGHGLAALCSEYAADLYGLAVLERDLQDFAGNETRFQIVARRPDWLPRRSWARRTALVVSLPNVPLALGGFLSAIGGWGGANVAPVHGLPTGQLRIYDHYMEVDADLLAAENAPLLGRLRERADRLLVLGSFPADGRGWRRRRPAGP